MSLDGHLDSLRRKHRSLDEKIEEEVRRPGVDQVAITAMKREKLHLKEEIARLSRNAPTEH